MSSLVFSLLSGVQRLKALYDKASSSKESSRDVWRFASEVGNALQKFERTGSLPMGVDIELQVDIHWLQRHGSLSL